MTGRLTDEQLRAWRDGFPHAADPGYYVAERAAIDELLAHRAFHVDYFGSMGEFDGFCRLYDEPTKDV